jgi:uncharacterized membrane protein YdjX (TVP38/TMEM64 family)
MNRLARWAALAGLTLLLILVPFALWEDPLRVWSERVLGSAASQSFAFVAVVVLLVLDVLLPIPSSIIAAFAVSTLSAVSGGAAVWLGLTLAAWVGYGLGRWGGFPLARRVAGATELDRASKLMARHGAWILLLCRGVPVLAEASTLFAGAARQRPWRFGLVIAVANLGVACSYGLIALFELRGFALVWVPIAFGVAVPGLGLYLMRRLAASSD